MSCTASPVWAALGRQRLTAIGQFEGGFIAREVKQLAPPASWWATGKGSRQIRYGEILKNSVRCGDPFLRQQDNWIGRRLSPSNCRIEIVDLPKEKDVDLLLHAMGFETANMHLGSIQRKKLRKAMDAIKPSELAKVVARLGKRGRTRLERVADAMSRAPIAPR